MSSPSFPTTIREFALLTVVATSVLPYTTIFAKQLSYLVVLVSYVGVSIYFIYTDSDLYAPRYILYPLLILSALLISHTILNLTGDSLIRTPIFIFAIFINIFIIGRELDVDSFSNVVSLLCTILIILGLPTVILQEYTFLGMELSSYHNSTTFLSVELFMMNSVMYNPNPFAQFVGIGTLCAIWRYYKQPGKISAVLAGLNGLGLLLTQSRSAIFATFVGIVLFALYVQRDDVFQIATVVTITFAGLFTVGYIYDVDILPDISFTGRLELWRAAVRASFESPIFGTGPGLTSETISPYLPSKYDGTVIHNSFLRVLVSNGIVGILSYIFLYLSTIGRLLKTIKNPASGFLACLLVTGMVMQIFESFSLFGISSSSVLNAIILGLGVSQISRLS